MIKSISQVVVRYAETDMMGVVYHGSYLPWFEIGRTTLLREHGLPYRQLEQQGYFLPVLEVQVKYHRPALYDDVLTISTTLAEKPSLRIRLSYQVLRGDVLLATGQTLHAFIDRQGKPVRPPAEFSSKMDQLFPGPTSQDPANGL